MNIIHGIKMQQNLYIVINPLKLQLNTPLKTFVQRDKNAYDCC